jgi:hypothetical protein
MRVDKGKPKYSKKNCASPLYPPQIPHDLTWDRSWVTAVGSGRWSMAWPSIILHTINSPAVIGNYFFLKYFWTVIQYLWNYQKNVSETDAVHVTFNLFPLGTQWNKRSPRAICRSSRCALQRQTKAKLLSCLMFFVSGIPLHRIQIPANDSMFGSSVITSMDGVVPNAE